MKKSISLILIKFITLLTLSSHALALNVLHIGDSHSAGIFGWEIDKLFRATEGVDQETYGSCGAVAKWYFTSKKTPCGYFFKTQTTSEQGTNAFTPHLPTLVENFLPHVISVEMGGNYAGYDNSFIKSDIKKTVKFINDTGAICVWISAPDSRKNQERRSEVAQIIKEEIGDTCAYFDSTAVTQYPATGGDGVHYWGAQGSKQAKAWAKAAYLFILKQTDL
jgi:hypothetical protein